MKKGILRTLKLELRILLLFLVLGLFWVGSSIPLHAQKPPKTLTLLYSNNINGEIEPCPT